MPKPDAWLHQVSEANGYTGDEQVGGALARTEQQLELARLYHRPAA